MNNLMNGLITSAELIGVYAFIGFINKSNINGKYERLMSVSILAEICFAVILSMSPDNSYFFRSLFIWVMGMILIMGIGKNVEYMMLGFSLMVFLSDFYEIPIYYQRFITNNNIDFILLSCKISFIIPSIISIGRLGLNRTKFIGSMITFALIYIPFSDLLYRLSLIYIPSLIEIIFVIVRVSVVFIIVYFIYVQHRDLIGVTNGHIRNP